MSISYISQRIRSHTPSMNFSYINLHIIIKIHHLCTLEYNIYIVTITEGSPVIETYMIKQIKHFHGLREVSSKGGTSSILKKILISTNLDA